MKKLNLILKFSEWILAVAGCANLIYAIVLGFSLGFIYVLIPSVMLAIFVLAIITIKSK